MLDVKMNIQFLLYKFLKLYIPELRREVCNEIVTIHFYTHTHHCNYSLQNQKIQ